MTLLLPIGMIACGGVDRYRLGVTSNGSTAIAPSAQVSTQSPDRSVPEGTPGSSNGGVAGVCGLDPMSDLPPCSDTEVPELDCDGSLRACSLSGSDSTRIHVCESGPVGGALAWRLGIAIPSRCENRPVIDCGDATSGPEQSVIDNEIFEIAQVCMGNESWLKVSFTNGCPTLYTSSQPASTGYTACLSERLNVRFTCAEQLPCAGAELSTLL